MKNNLRNRIKNVQGFTLTEMIVVLAIIGILIALIAPNVARLIGSAQETSDDVVADQFLTAAQAYTTDAIRSNFNVTAAAATNGGVPLTNLTATALGDVYVNNDGDAYTVAFLGADGDTLMSDSALAADEGVFIYLSEQGAVMGTVYYNTTTSAVISVAGTAPATKAPADTEFIGEVLREADATVDQATGVITTP